MTKLSYEYTAPNGTTERVATFPEVEEKIAAKGGRYKATFEPIPEKVHSFGFGIVGCSKSAYRG